MVNIKVDGNIKLIVIVIRVVENVFNKYKNRIGWILVFWFCLWLVMEVMISINIKIGVIVFSVLMNNVFSKFIVSVV